MGVIVLLVFDCVLPGCYCVVDMLVCVVSGFIGLLICACVLLDFYCFIDMWLGVAWVFACCW